MSEAKHTPGPWRDSVELRGTHKLFAAVHSGQGVLIANCGAEDCVEHRANAKLIAAAPALADALRAALNESGCDGDLCNYRWHDQARAALCAAGLEVA
jgi:hypothetical protein